MNEGGGDATEQDMAGAQDTIYLCNFRVSVDGEWLCLKELNDVEFNMQDSIIQPIDTPSPDTPVQPFGSVFVCCRYLCRNFRSWEYLTIVFCLQVGIRWS